MARGPVGARQLVLPLDARRVHLGEALEMREGLGGLAVIEVVVGEPEIGLSVAEARVPGKRLLDRRAAVGLVTEAEPGGPEVVRGPGHLGRPGVGASRWDSARAGSPSSTSRRPRSARAVASWGFIPTARSSSRIVSHRSMARGIRKRTAREVSVPGGPDHDHDHEREDRIAPHPRQDAEEEQVPHEVTIEARPARGQADGARPPAP